MKISGKRHHRRETEGPLWLAGDLWEVLNGDSGTSKWLTMQTPQKTECHRGNKKGGDEGVWSSDTTWRLFLVLGVGHKPSIVHVWVQFVHSMVSLGECWPNVVLLIWYILPILKSINVTLLTFPTQELPSAASLHYLTTWMQARIAQ